MYRLDEVNGQDCADEINRLNGLFPDDFLPLKPHHLAKGYWWLAHIEHQVIGFCGMVPFTPFPRIGYLKRAAVLSAHRGNGLQQQMMSVRLVKARESTDWTHVVSECGFDRVASANNHIAAGFRLFDPERAWEKDTLFWIRELVRG